MIFAIDTAAIQASEIRAKEVMHACMHGPIAGAAIIARFILLTRICGFRWPHAGTSILK